MKKNYELNKKNPDNFPKKNMKTKNTNIYSYLL